MKDKASNLINTGGVHDCRVLQKDIQAVWILQFFSLQFLLPLCQLLCNHRSESQLSMQKSEESAYSICLQHCLEVVYIFIHMIPRLKLDCCPFSTISHCMKFQCNYFLSQSISVQCAVEKYSNQMQKPEKQFALLLTVMYFIL